MLLSNGHSTCLDGRLNVDTAHVDANIASHLNETTHNTQRLHNITSDE